MVRKSAGKLGRELLEAAKAGRVADVVVALDEGADLNFASTDINSMKDTPLHFAALHGREEVVETLLERGADVHAKNYWAGTALHMACKRGQHRVVVQLRKAGAHSDRGDIKQKTPTDHTNALKDPELRKKTLEALQTAARPPPNKALGNAFSQGRRVDAMTGMRRARLAAERKTKPMEQWSAPCVGEWLRSMAYAGLPETVVEEFLDNEVDGEMLMALVGQDSGGLWEGLDVLPKHRMILTKTIREISGISTAGGASGDGVGGADVVKALHEMGARIYTDPLPRASFLCCVVAETARCDASEGKLEAKLNSVQRTADATLSGVSDLKQAMAEMSKKLDRNFSAVRSLIDGEGAVPTLW